MDSAKRRPSIFLKGIVGGLFGIVSKKDCTTDLFYGTDYHSHLGTKRGGMAVKNSKGYERAIVLAKMKLIPVRDFPPNKLPFF